MALLELLSEFLQPLLDLVPRMSHRPASNEFMVYDGPVNGVSVKRWPVVYFPIVSHVEYYPRNEHPIDCGIQKLTDHENEPVIVNATMRIKIDDPVQLRQKAGSETWEECIAMIARAAVCDAVWAHGTEGIHEEVAKVIRWELATLGVDIAKFKIEDTQFVFPISVTE